MALHEEIAGCRDELSSFMDNTPSRGLSVKYMGRITELVSTLNTLGILTPNQIPVANKIEDSKESLKVIQLWSVYLLYLAGMSKTGNLKSARNLARDVIPAVANRL